VCICFAGWSGVERSFFERRVLEREGEKEILACDVRVCVSIYIRGGRGDTTTVDDDCIVVYQQRRRTKRSPVPLVTYLSPPGDSIDRRFRKRTPPSACQIEARRPRRNAHTEPFLGNDATPLPRGDRHRVQGVCRVERRSPKTSPAPDGRFRGTEDGLAAAADNGNRKSRDDEQSSRAFQGWMREAFQLLLPVRTSA
jgi:hypothetical protein